MMGVPTYGKPAAETKRGSTTALNYSRPRAAHHSARVLSDAITYPNIFVDSVMVSV
jgi:hypothetical protein